MAADPKTAEQPQAPRAEFTVYKLDDRHLGYTLEPYEYRMSLLQFDVNVHITTVARIMRRPLARIELDLGPFILKGGWIAPQSFAAYLLAAQPRRGPHEYRMLVQFADLARKEMLQHLHQMLMEAGEKAIDLAERSTKLAQAALTEGEGWKTRALKLERFLSYSPYGVARYLGYARRGRRSRRRQMAN